jgi:imidazole glycerol-phosphate synthase subunit HisH
MKVGVVDYEAGNLRSVETALLHLGAEFLVSDDPVRLAETDKLVFPGVGEAAAAMRVLRRTRLDQVIRDFADSGKPVLGICVGCQVLLDLSEEGDTRCLGLISGRVRRFAAGTGLKVPHMGWNRVDHDGTGIFTGLPAGCSCYFVHSYYPEPLDSEAVIGRTEYGIEFASAIRSGSITATQFHPEKSGPVGLRILDNFLRGST